MDYSVAGVHRAPPAHLSAEITLSLTQLWLNSALKLQDL